MILRKETTKPHFSASVIATKTSFFNKDIEKVYVGSDLKFLAKFIQEFH